MPCDQCIGLLIISVVSISIGAYLIKDYIERKKLFSILMSIFYFLVGVAWLFKFFLLDWLFNIYSTYESLYLAIELIPFVYLLIIILDFLLVKWYYWMMIIAGTTLFIVIHIFFPLNLVVIYVLYGIIITDVFLFGINWYKYKNNRDIGVLIGLSTIFTAQIYIFYSTMIYGILLTITAFIWIVNYTKVMDKVE